MTIEGAAADTPASLTASAAAAARHGGAALLSAALHDSRRDTLATFAAFERALPGLRVALDARLNPPLWELGHIGWFQDHWLGRNPAWADGVRADPDVPRRPPRRAGADALYDSSRVSHASRWQLPLPDADATRGDLAEQLAAARALLQQLPRDGLGNTVSGDRRGGADTDRALYFFRLALLHEDMHHEAALMTAQTLGIDLRATRWQPLALPPPPPAIALQACSWRLGSDAAAGGFAFDNELPAHAVAVGNCEIDAQAVRWAEYLPFAEAGGYRDDRWWSPAGLQWRNAERAVAPRHLRRAAGSSGWQQWRHGHWQPLHAAEAACHLTQHEALAWCRWAGRRLPSEAEWERAAVGRPADAAAGNGTPAGRPGDAAARPAGFRWGDVWEWTSSLFAPYAVPPSRFEPHPYRDYSAPWFDGRAVLRGASWLTQPRMRHPRFRNFFAAERNDVAAGFRSCAV